MDNLTHSLTGLALARATLFANRGKPLVPHATLLMVIAANIPDIDMVSLPLGALRNFEIHRGYTHTLLLLPVMAALAVLITAAVKRTALPWRSAWLLAMVAVASHLMLDWSMSYGIRLLLPFSSEWFHLDLFSLMDWVVLTVLGIAWLGPMLGRLVSDEIGDRRGTGRGLAAFALLFFASYGGFRWLMHQRAIDQLQSRIYDTVLGGPAIRMAAFPGSVDPMHWHAVVQSEARSIVYELNALAPFDPEDGQLFYQAHWNSQLQSLSATPDFRYALYFARFPQWQTTPAPGSKPGTLVRMTDLRFGVPGQSFFTVSATLEPDGKVHDVKWLR